MAKFRESERITHEQEFSRLITNASEDHRRYLNVGIKQIFFNREREDTICENLGLKFDRARPIGDLGEISCKPFRSTGIYEMCVSVSCVNSAWI